MFTNSIIIHSMNRSPIVSINVTTQSQRIRKIKNIKCVGFRHPINVKNYFPFSGVITSIIARTCNAGFEYSTKTTSYRWNRANRRRGGPFRCRASAARTGRE